MSGVSRTENAGFILSRVSNAKPSVSKYVQYAAGIICGLGVVAGATVLGMHGLNAWATVGVAAAGGLGGLGALACARLCAQRARFDHLVNKMKKGIKISIEEASAPLVVGGMTPAQMALHRFIEEGKGVYLDVAMNFIIPGGGGAANALTSENWHVLINGVGVKGIKSLLKTGLDLSSKEKAREAIDTLVETNDTFRDQVRTECEEKYNTDTFFYRQLGDEQNVFNLKQRLNKDSSPVNFFLRRNLS